MGHGTWYYSLGVFLEIVDVFVRSEFEISSWRGAGVDVRTYLLGGTIDSSEANGIIRDPKLELESSRFTFDLLPLSYESVVRAEKTTKDDTSLVGVTKEDRFPYGILVPGARRFAKCAVVKTTFRKARGGVRVTREDDRGVTEGREDVGEVFQQRRSGAKRKLSRCGRNQMGTHDADLGISGRTETISVVYYTREEGFGSMITIWEKANVDVVPWSRKGRSEAKR
ncbi:hypothetical protein Tco_1401980 [Tanacetum coccineum]